MKKLLRYLVNTILFIVLWGVQLFIVIGYSVAEVGVRPSGSIAIGGIVALIISFAIVNRINKSKLWTKLFQEEDTKEYKLLKKIMIVIFGIFLIILIRDLILYILIPYLNVKGIL
tara:strand:- start:272 stop:616 length:345 start_codon:yes stop_codon:yes gene_type:complete